jgi:hypothetical protein
MVRPDQKHGMRPILVKRVRKKSVGKPNGERNHRNETCNESDDENRFLHLRSSLLDIQENGSKTILAG